jgi:CRISPR-associated protein Csh2
MNTQTVSRRSEILFVYDVTDANPNGDPNDENRPRMDLETGQAKVSDVRLKRTIRDYLHDYGGREIFCREIEKADGTIQEGKDRAEDFFQRVAEDARRRATTVLQKRDLIQAGVIGECIDVRLFGATIPVSKVQKNEKDSSVTLTGPVQFAMGTSLHRVEPRFIKGTGAFASSQGAQQRTFREEYILPYALIAFYGIVNQQAAQTTKLTDADVEELFKAVWYGTKNLISRSKIGQRPLLLLAVDYKEPNAYVGRLDRFLAIKASAKGNGEPLRDEQIRDVREVVLQLAGLSAALEQKKEQIAQVRYAWDERLALSEKPMDKTFLGCPAAPMPWDDHALQRPPE